MSKRIKDIFQYCLGGIIVLCFFGILYVLIFIELPPSNRDAMNIMLGITGTLTAGVGNYFFGSSKGSSEKNDIIADKRS